MNALEALTLEQLERHDDASVAVEELARRVRSAERTIDRFRALCGDLGGPLVVLTTIEAQAKKIARLERRALRVDTRARVLLVELTGPRNLGLVIEAAMRELRAELESE